MNTQSLLNELVLASFHNILTLEKLVSITRYAPGGNTIRAAYVNVLRTLDEGDRWPHDQFVADIVKLKCFEGLYPTAGLLVYTTTTYL